MIYYPVVLTYESDDENQNITGFLRTGFPVPWVSFESPTIKLQTKCVQLYIHADLYIYIYMYIYTKVLSIYIYTK